LADPVDLARGQLVEHDDVAWRERRRQERLDVSEQGGSHASR